MKTGIPLTLPSLAALFTVLLYSLPADANSTSGLRQKEAVLVTTPQEVLIDSFDNWTIGGGFIYTSQIPSVDNPSPWRFNRRPQNGMAGRLLAYTSTLGAPPWSVMRADDYGVYYLNLSVSPAQLEFRAIPTATTSFVVTQVTSTSDLALTSDDAYYYLAEPTQVSRGRRDALGIYTLSTLTGVNSLYVDDAYIWMMNGSGVYRQGKNCVTASCPAGYQLELWANAPSGKHLRLVNGTAYFWRNAGTGWNLYKMIGTNKGFSLLYTDTTGNLDVGPVVANDTHLFWVELPPSGGMRMRRMPVGGGTAETIASGSTIGSVDLKQLYADAQGVLYYNGVGVYRMPFSADAVSWNLAFSDLQAVQANQNWTFASGDVPLVGDKPTFVRVVGQLKSGTDVVGVEGVQHGTTTGGAALPGSPLQPLTHKWLPNLVSGVVPEQNTTQEYWLFQLPAGWDDPGSIRLKFDIDPRHIFDDPDLSDNSSGWIELTFRNAPPLCAVFIPVHTHNPLPSIQDPWFAEAVSLWARLWPGPGIWTYRQIAPIEELELCWWGPFPYPCFGPYELDQGSDWDNWIPDADKVNLSLFERYLISDDPDECDNRGAPVHYVGMVHALAATDYNGLGCTVGNFFWARMPFASKYPDYGNWNWPWSGTTLAHEAGHNWYRDHSPCKGTESDVDSNYPYGDCKIDLWNANVPEAHWGFDAGTRQFINPRETADLMSYGSPRWMSDYTYKAIMENIGTGTALHRSSSAQSFRAPRLSPASFAARVNGAVDLVTGEGRLNWGWVMPTASMSSGVLRKWQSLAGTDVSQSTPTGTYGTALPPIYHIRLLDAKRLLISDTTFVPQPPSSELSRPGADNRKAIFSVTFPHPSSPTVAAVQLMRDNQVLDALTPGLAAPFLRIVQPAGQETFVSSMTIQWEAGDTAEDKLRFLVQYSPDNGTRWMTLASDLPAAKGQITHSLPLNDLTFLPGTGSRYTGLIRIAASDGYHTSLATSQAFRVSNQPPQPTILRPLEGRIFPPGQSMDLAGLAVDAEDGNLGDSSLSWQISPGGVLGTGANKVLEGWRPGSYTFTLTARDSGGTERSASVQAAIANVAVPKVTAPALDGRCSDGAYETGPRLPLPFHNAGRGTVKLARTNTHLWVCFSGLDHIAGYTGEAGVLVDPDRSGGTAPQSSDKAFFVLQDGTPFVRQGNGSTFSVVGSTVGLDARVTGNTSVWNVEIRIEKSLVGNWDHLAGMAFQFSTAVAGTLSPVSYYWPWLATKNNPSTFAMVALGLVPQITSLSSNTAPVGGSAFYLTVTGTDFTSSAQVLWDGQPLETAAFPPTTALAQVTANKLTNAGEVAVSVRNGTNDFLSNSMSFEVKNPVPVLSGIQPASIRAGSPTFQLTVNGTNFMSGAVAYWNGEERPTQLLSDTQLIVQIQASDVATPKTAGITVNTPSPGGGTTAPAKIQVLGDISIFLPVVQK